MNPELKSKWVGALRSGEYKQGKTALRSKDDKYCCLGVLCEISGMKRVQDTNAMGDRRWRYYFNGDSCTTVLPGGFSKEVDNVSSQLIVMNDDAGKNFNEIADYIEANL